MSEDNFLPCSLFRRFLAISYDLILLFSLLFFATLILLPLTGGHAIKNSNFLYTFYLFIWSYFYFIWQWLHGGQTLGMKAWKVVIINNNRQFLNRKEASLRFFLALCSWAMIGGGFIWALFDPDKKTFHDRYSNTIILRKN